MAINGRQIGLCLAAAALGCALGWYAGSTGPSAPFPTVTTAPATSSEARDRLSETLRIENTRERTARLLELLAVTDPRFAPAFGGLLLAPDDDLIVDETAEALIAQWWAESDPAAAYREAVNPRWSERHPWMREVMRAWTKQDPSAAAAAVLDLPPGPTIGRLEAARSVVDTWMALEDMPDPAPLLQVIKHLEPIARGGALQHVVGSMAERQGIEPTLQFVRSMAANDQTSVDRDVVQEVLARTAVVLLDHDPNLAVAWAREHANSPAAVGIHKHLAYYWGLRDGESAMEWALSLPADTRPMAVKRAWVSFGRKQKEGARTWLHARAPDASLAGIYTRHLQVLAESEPQLAASLAARAEDPEIRQRMQAAVARGWSRTDPQAAAAWLAGAND